MAHTGRKAKTTQPESLEEFLRKKHEAADQANQVDWPQRLFEWQRSVKELHTEIEAWLTPSINAGHVQLSRQETKLAEEAVGSYPVDRLIISVGADRVTVEPVGMRILGAKGRVDVRGPTSEAMLIRDSAGLWFIANRMARPPRLSKIPLNEESFAALIRQVMTP
jgi:hypothetical protein